MGKIKVGIIGVGRLGSLHAKVYDQISNAELVGVHDKKSSRGKEVAQTYNIKSYQNYHSLLKNVDAVSIAVPTTKHFEISKECIKENVHLLIEKPITSTLEEANKLFNLAKQGDSIIQVGHVERFNAAVKAICKMPQIPRFIECHRLGPFTTRGTDVSVTIDLMIHDIDIMLELVESKIKHIDAVGVEVLSNKNDIVNARFTFQDDTVANLTSSRVSKETMRKIRVFQKEAYISLDYVKQKAALYKKEKGEIIKENIPVEKEEPLQAELSSFIKCIQEKKAPLVSVEEATKALKIALEIENIVESKKKKIS